MKFTPIKNTQNDRKSLFYDTEMRSELKWKRKKFFLTCLLALSIPISTEQSRLYSMKYEWMQFMLSCYRQGNVNRDILFDDIVYCLLLCTRIYVAAQCFNAGD